MFGTTESGVDRRVLRSFVVTLVFIASWLAIAVSDFGSARIAGAVPSTSETAVFPRVKLAIRTVRAAMDFGFS